MPPNRLDSTLKELSQLYPDSYLMGDSGLLDEPDVAKNVDGGSKKVSDGEVPLIPFDQLCAIAFYFW